PAATQCLQDDTNTGRHNGLKEKACAYKNPSVAQPEPSNHAEPSRSGARICLLRAELGLHQGATPVFIPPREPWRNGTIERFNDTFDKRFFRQERFTDRDQLAERAGAFEAFHNSQHRYQATHGRAPDETAPAPRRDPLGVDELPAG